MRIYFAGSIRGGREDASIYSKIINHLKNYGDVLTEHIGNPNVTDSGEEINEKFIHDRDLVWLKKADIVIAEITTPSLGVGYELGLATQNNKKILCLYRTKQGKKPSAMILGNSQIYSKEYETLEQAKQIIDNFLTE